MSRIGKAPIAIPAGVTVTVDANNVVTVKGPHGELKQAVNPDLTVTVEDNHVHISRPATTSSTAASTVSTALSSTTWWKAFTSATARKWNS